MHVAQLVSENKWSFPSRHMTFFFAISTALYFYNKRWGVVFLIAALLIGIARVIAGVHYPLDILGGAVIGVITSYLVFRFLK